MADPTEVDEPDGDEDPKPAAKNWRKEFKERAEQAEAEAAELKRELAFTKAGLSDLSDKQVKALLAAHEGDVTADAIKATATELGFGAAPAEVTDPEKEQRATELAGMAKAASGVTPANPSVPSFNDQIEEFKGDYQAFKQFVLENADRVLS